MRFQAPGPALNLDPLLDQERITAARALVEATCKAILDDLAMPYEETDDLPKLYWAMTRLLETAPEPQMEEQSGVSLGGCASTVEGLESLRNRSGDPHGKGRTAYRLYARHAALAVNPSGTTATC